MPKLNRRQFLTLSAGSAVAVLLSQCSSGQSQESHQSPTSSSNPSPAGVYSSNNGLLELNLEAKVNSVAVSRLYRKNSLPLPYP
jgi:hypothetical protein